MNLDQYLQSLQNDTPPAGLSAALLALWWERRGDWQRAHEAAQSDEGVDAARAHAYLHRVEGDLANAQYWYRRAGHSAAQGPLQQEWAALTAELLR